MNIDFEVIVALISGSLGIIATFLATVNFVITKIKQGKLKQLVDITLQESKKLLGQGDKSFKLIEQKYLDTLQEINELKVLMSDKDKATEEKIAELTSKIVALDELLKQRTKQYEDIKRKLEQ